LIPPERSGASVQRRYITSENFDFSIDDGKRVTLLTSDSNVWQNIEAGTRIVMRVVFEQLAFYSAIYECHLCGTRNELVSFSNSSEWLTDGSLDCHACKARFQISLDRDGKKQGRNDHIGIDTETRHCIRNFHVMQTPAPFPFVPPSDLNVEVLTTWRIITSHPDFKLSNIDINELCSEFTDKARSDGKKVVLDPQGVSSIMETLTRLRASAS